ncbi:MAG: glycosyltransferase [Magnetococcales bacterium]|nr:glycosyltransferase [Magnetococcales bacterium]
MPPPAISVFIATYNYLNSLKLCLASLERQSLDDFEVLIADDGSGPEVGEWLATYRPQAPFALQHLWHEDRGFRKCRILNRCLLAARGDYCLFLDADCIQGRHFLQTHWDHRQPGRYLGGRRVMIARPVAETVTEAMVRSGVFDHISLWSLRHTLTGGIRSLEEAWAPLHTLRPRHPFRLLGCNFSLHREDLFRVNGFDEDYENRGGGEDTDVSARLETLGITLKSVRYLAAQYHLGHEKAGEKSASLELFREKSAQLANPAAAVAINSAVARWKADRGRPDSNVPEAFGKS